MDRSQIFPRRENALEWCFKNVKEGFKIDKSTKIVSAGSCFAREIKDWLIRNDFNYLTGETDKNPWCTQCIWPNEPLSYEHGSIAWERIYNVQTLYQLLRYAINSSRKESNYSLSDRLHLFKHDEEYLIADLFRSRIVYPNKKVAEEDIEEHTKETIKIIKEADVFIFTLGMTEVELYTLNLPFILANYSREYGLNRDYITSIAYNYDKVLIDLLSVHSFLQHINKDIKLILTVSPVPFNITYRRDVDAITANCESKSILRLVAGRVSALRKDVHYFPSYEIATVVAPLIGVKTYEEDNHHVSGDVINKIMDVFNSRYVNE